MLPPMTPIEPAFAGTSRFRPVALLGQGSLGIVYRAHDEETGQEVALKTIRDPIPEQVLFLKAEFRSLADITHPNLVQLHELFVERHTCFFTMELLDGVTFTEHLRATAGDGEGAGQRFVDALEQLVRGVSTLHQAGRLHRDIKPSNVMVTREGRVVLLDFDLAIRLRPERLEAEAPGELTGTAPYMAPEQIWGMPPGTSADWYSVGVLVYEALSGRLPFTGPLSTMLRAKEQARFAPIEALPRGAPAALPALVRALLDPEPTGRPDGEALLAAIHARPAAPVHRVTPPADTPFVGRAAELETLREALAAAAAGQPAVVLLEGGSGMGKSELVRRFLDGPEADEERVVLRGRCHHQESVPYRAFDSLIDGLSRFLLAEEATPDLPAPAAAALVRLFPVLRRVPWPAVEPESVHAIEPHEHRRRGFAALRDLLAGIAARRRLVIWIDDLQWGDADSVLLLREILAPPHTPPMLVILSYRSEDADLVTSLRALPASVALPRERVHRLALGPLADSEARELATRLLGSAASDRIDAVVEESQGSPFFIGELSRHHGESASGPLPAGHRAGGIARVVEERLDRLSPKERQILAVVAVAGRPMPRSIILEAAQLGEHARPSVVRLVHLCLLRPMELAERPAVEAYHDRIREAVLAIMPAAEQRSCHQQVAMTLEARGGADPEVLTLHFEHAGEVTKAAAYAEHAAERAARALAFDQAARLYRRALSLGDGSAARERALTVRLGDALANAGRGAEAAEAYLRAARDAEPVEQRDLRRLAAHQYLRAGSMDNGIETLREVLRTVDTSLPQRAATTIAAVLQQRALLRIRGLRYVVRRSAPAPEETLRRLDTLWSAGAALSIVDPTLSAAFQSRHLRLALDLGEPERLARALGVEAAYLSTLGGAANWRRSEAIMSDVTTLARMAGQPYAWAQSRFAAGVTAFMAGRWRHAFESFDEAARRFRDECTGAAWEVATNHSFANTALAYLGRIGDLAARVPAQIREADERGDAYGGATLRAGLNTLHLLASDRPEEAGRLAAEARERWPHRGFHTQHYMQLLGAAQAELYAGDAAAAEERVARGVSAARSAHMLRIAYVRVELRHLRARCALAAAARPAGGLRSVLRWEARLRRAEADARALDAEELPCARPFAEAIRAGALCARGRAEAAARALGAAAIGFERLDMQLYAGAARLCRAALDGARPARAAAEEASLARLGVAAPRRTAAMLIPGIAAVDAADR